MYVCVCVCVCVCACARVRVRVHVEGSQEAVALLFGVCFQCRCVAGCGLRSQGLLWYNTWAILHRHDNKGGSFLHRLLKNNLIHSWKLFVHQHTELHFSALNEVRHIFLFARKHYTSINIAKVSNNLFVKWYLTLQSWSFGCGSTNGEWWYFDVLHGTEWLLYCVL